MDLVKKLQKYTPFAYSWSTNDERRKSGAVCILHRGSDIDEMEQYCIVEAGISVGDGCIMY